MNEGDFLNSLHKSKSSMRTIVLSLLFIFFHFTHFAQIAISGVIINESDQTPIIGASILEQGTNNGTISDVEGKFQLTVTVTANANLEISYLGYETKIVEIAGQTQIEILLSEEAQTLEGVVVTAFGIEKEKKALEDRWGRKVNLRFIQEVTGGDPVSE